MGLRLDMRAYRWAAWVGIVALVALAILAAFDGKAWGAAGLGAAALGAALFIHWRERLPSLFSLLFVVAGLLNGLGWVFDFWNVPLFDPVTHGYTTFAVALALGFLAYYSVAVHFRGHGIMFVITIASFGLALGGLWEIFEWSMAVPQSYRGIAVDLISDALGALAAGALAAFAVSRGRTG
jgi:hypothetical protein